MDSHPIQDPGNFEGFETLYSMLKYKDLTGSAVRERYQVVELLGAGGMGDVYRAIDLKEKRTVALKRLVPPSKSKQRASMEKNFLKEVACLEAISSPYVVEIYDAFKLDFHYYLIMEYIDGKTLENIVKETHNTSKALSPLEYIAVMTKLSRGLEAIHTVGIVHRDIKPANIMINRLKDIVKILDLGLACRIENKNELGDFSGTIAYMSPEQITSGSDLTPSSDIFSLGSTFYFMITGLIPFSGTGVQCMVQICEKMPEFPHKINKDVPEKLSNLVMRTLEKDPQKRFANASELSYALENLHIRFSTHISEILKPDKNSLILSATKKLSPAELYFLKQIADLRNPSLSARTSAVKHLGRLRDVKAIKPMLTLLSEARASDQHDLVRHILVALRKIGNMNVIEPIREVIHSSSNPEIKKLGETVLDRLLNEHPNLFLCRCERAWDRMMLDWDGTKNRLLLHLRRWKGQWDDFSEKNRRKDQP